MLVLQGQAMEAMEASFARMHVLAWEGQGFRPLRVEGAGVARLDLSFIVANSKTILLPSARLP